MNMGRVLFVIVMMMIVVVSRSEDGGSGTADSIPHLNVNLNNPDLGVVKKTVRGFSAIDTNYVEPQHYNYTVMLQNTNTYEVYRLTTESGYSITFAPQPSVKLGPYVGWRWIFLGYTVDLTHISSGDKKTEFDLSLYSSQIGIDLFYRKTGNDYRIRSISIGKDIDTSPLHNTKFDGLSASIKGFNLYYIFNHKKFSYPAAYS